MSATSDGPVPDVLGPGTRLLLVGINPGRHSARAGCHFAGPGNRFWPALHAAGLTPRELAPHEQHLLPRLGLGITNLVAHATDRADELHAAALVGGGQRLIALVRRRRPAAVAVLGVGAFRIAFGDRTAAIGSRGRDADGVAWWVLANPSGLNAAWTVPRHADMLAAVAAEAGHGPARAVAPR